MSPSFFIIATHHFEHCLKPNIAELRSHMTFTGGPENISSHLHGTWKSTQ